MQQNCWGCCPPSLYGGFGSSPWCCSGQRSCRWGRESPHPWAWRSLGCSQQGTTGLGWVGKELQPTDRENGEKLRQEHLGVLESSGYTDSGKHKCYCFSGRYCHCPLAFVMCEPHMDGDVGCTMGVHPQETCNFHPPCFPPLCARKDDLNER